MYGLDTMVLTKRYDAELEVAELNKLVRSKKEGQD